MIKTEIKNALHGKAFQFALIIGIVITVAGAFTSISEDRYTAEICKKYFINADGTMNSNPMIPAETLYRRWIGGDFSSRFTMIFYYLLPLLAALPFSWSLASEIKSGYRKQSIVRCGRLNYYFSKYIAAFVSGALVITIPIIINYVIVACFVPARMPDPGYSIYYAINMTSFCSKLFYTIPFVYDILILLIDAVFAGIWASFCLTLGFFIKNKASVVILPYILLFLHQLLCSLISAYRFYIELSPFNFLKGFLESNEISGWVILFSSLILLLSSASITYIKGKRDNVY